MISRNKKILAGALSLGMVAALAIGGTLAYLTDSTEQRANNFTFATNGIDAMLTEPDWDGVIDYLYPDDPDYPTGSTDPIVPVYGYDDHDKPITDITKRPTKDADGNPIEYGDEKSKNMIPGQMAKKNPFITNTGTMTDEWVAAKVTFVYGEGSANAGKALNAADWDIVKNNIVVDYNTAESEDGYWTLVVDGADTVSQTYYYSKILAKGTETNGKVTYGEVTQPIFNTVTLKNTANNEAVQKLIDMGGIAIYIEGYAVQSDAFANYTAWKASESAVFDHTPTTDTAADTGVASPGIFPKDTPTPAPESGS